MFFLILFICILLFASLTILFSAGQQNAIYYSSIEVAGEHYLTERQIKIITFIGATISGLLWYVYQPLDIFISLLPPSLFIDESSYLLAITISYGIMMLIMLLTLIFKFPQSPIMVMYTTLLGVYLLQKGSLTTYDIFLILLPFAFIILMPIVTAFIQFFLFRLTENALLTKHRPRERFTIIVSMALMVMGFALIGYLTWGAYYIFSDLTWKIVISTILFLYLIFCYWFLREIIRRQAFKFTDDKRGAERAFRIFQWFPVCFNHILYSAIEMGFYLVPVTIIWHFFVHNQVALNSHMPFWVYLIAVLIYLLGVWLFTARFRDIYTDLFDKFTNARSFTLQYSQFLFLSIWNLFLMPIIPLYSYFGAHIGQSIYDEKGSLFKRARFYKIVAGFIAWPALAGGTSALGFFIAKLFL